MRGLMAFVIALAACSQPATAPLDAGGCGGACGAGTACVLGRCVIGDASAPDVGDVMVVDAANADSAVRLDAASDRPAPLDAIADIGSDVLPPGCVSATVGNCCGVACEASAHAAAVCSGGRCTVRCDPGFADCDHDNTNGCEVELATNELNCGRCGGTCALGQPCTAGECRCAAGRSWCDGACVEVTNNDAHCGACGVSCTGGQHCLEGRCGCTLGLTNCSGVCKELLTDAENCGACGAACAAGRACVNGACVVCTGGAVTCRTGCSTLTDDVMNCGACGQACPREPHSTPRCQAGICLNTCDTGFTDCSIAPGCESDLMNDPQRCGSCGRRCSDTGVPNATTVCRSGSCGLECALGFANCDSTTTNGCEANTLSGHDTCGSCTRRCASTEECRGGVCYPR